MSKKESQFKTARDCSFTIDLKFIPEERREEFRKVKSLPPKIEKKSFLEYSQGESDE